MLGVCDVFANVYHTPRNNMTCLVWFNGPSSNKLHHIPKKYYEIGCNHIRENRSVDAVCVYDPRQKDKIPIEDGVQYYSRNGAYDENYLEVTYPMSQQPENSGMLAVLVALKKGYRDIYIVGCDWGITTETIYQRHYSTRAEFKHRNFMKNMLKEWCVIYKANIQVVSDGEPDVSLPIIRSDSFLSELYG